MELEQEEDFIAHNQSILNKYNISEEDLEDLLEGATINSGIQIVDKPQGEEHATYSRFNRVYSIIFSVGEGGDDYVGGLYIKVEEGKYLEIIWET